MEVVGPSGSLKSEAGHRDIPWRLQMLAVSSVADARDLTTESNRLESEFVAFKEFQGGATGSWVEGAVAWGSGRGLSER